jgi:hypothetical protein
MPWWAWVQPAAFALRTRFRNSAEEIMRKIPTLFDRDWNGDRSRVVPTLHPACGWVAAGEGVATRKLDGTSCLIAEGRLFKRRELKKGQAAPPGFVTADFDEETGKTVGWLPVGDGPEDRWHREAFSAGLADGTYELIGPNVQGNPERVPTNRLVPHSSPDLVITEQVPTSFEGLAQWLLAKDMEGIVWHHRDGRMAKIKLRDFGLKRGAG